MKHSQISRSLLYLVGVHVGKGHGGTPTLVEHSGSTFRPDDATLKLVVHVTQKFLSDAGRDMGIKRHALYLLASSARQEPKLKTQLGDALAMMITDVDNSPKNKGNKLEPASATDWNLQHAVFAALRFSGTPAAASDIAGACFLGLGSPDRVGARHALALAEELSLKSPNLVIHEMLPMMESILTAYGASGPEACVPPTCQINLKDQFSRAHLARICARIIYSDQGSVDISGNGGPFWRMLCLIISRDPSDMVRFAALMALSGAVTSPAEAVLGPHSLGKSKDDAVLQQRRARAWRLLVSQADSEIDVLGVSEKQGLKPKLIQVIGRLILLALNKPVRASRFAVAATVVSSLARSCMASKVVGSSKQVSPEVDKVMDILAKELSGLIESPLSGAQRAACIEALLYLQAAGFSGSLSATSFALVGGEGGSGGGSQDSLLAAVLRCSRLSPDQAPLFLEYASGIVGIAPSAVDLAKVTALWNAACEGGSPHAVRNAALIAALSALRGPLPPSVMSRIGASFEGSLRAARNDAGWSAFVATAAWWLGENANNLCGEFTGKNVEAITYRLDSSDSDDVGDKESTSDVAIESEQEDIVDQSIDKAKLLEVHASRNPALSVIIATLHEIVLTGKWQLRAAGARALGKIAIRSGEPFRLQCYGILLSISSSSDDQDPLGLRGIVSPALSLLDCIYGSQKIIENLFVEYGDDTAEWPEDIINSVARRADYIHQLVESSFCSAPKSKYILLGARLVEVLANIDEKTDYASFLNSDDTKVGCSAFLSLENGIVIYRLLYVG